MVENAMKIAEILGPIVLLMLLNGANCKTDGQKIILSYSL